MMRTKLPVDHPINPQRARYMKRWQTPVLSAVAASVLALAAADANALALGRLAVQSALGEPLRAEIDVPQINAEEASTLRVGVAPASAFASAGFEFNPVVASVQVSLQRRPDGRYFIRLTGDRSVNDPFVDLVVEANWVSGRIVRDYTMLFDPPSLRQAAPQVLPPAGSSAPLPAAVPVPRSAGSASPPPARPIAAAPRAIPAPAPAPVAAAPRPASSGASGAQVTVRNGDTASRIASANKPANVSLDQMLLALLQSNPNAFVAGNINRLRSGAVLDLPSAEQAGAVPSGEARQTLVAQSRDFNEFRRRLAENAPAAPAAATGRQSAGQVQANVEDRRPGATAPDRLTLSRGATPGAAAGTPAAEDRAAQARAAQDANTRVAELSRNINELARIQGAASSPATGAAAGSAAGTAPAGAGTSPAATVPATPGAPGAAVVPPLVAGAPGAVPAISSASAPAGAASVPAVATVDTPLAAASAPATAASAAVVAAPVVAPVTAKKPAVAPMPVDEPSFLDSLLENPLIPAAALALLLLVLGYGGYRYRQRKKGAQVDSSFLESRLQPDSFFGASGGQRVDTNEAAPSASSMVYSPSQLDAAGDVDPVAEADVYLAYGRDLQAEEILKEALRSNSQRVAIHLKLLEIYAKRRDVKAFEGVAVEAYRLTAGSGEDWSKVCELGHELDPDNKLYQPGGEPSDITAFPAAAAGAFLASASATVPQSAQPELAPAPGVDLDLDLDFSAGEPSASPRAAPPSFAPSSYGDDQTMAVPTFSTSEPAPLDMDFNIGTVGIRPTANTEPAPLRIDLPISEPPVPSLPPMRDEPSAPAPLSASRAAPEAMDSGLIEFDLGSLSLDLGDNNPAGSTENTAMAPLPELSGDGNDSGLTTKLALAEEFRAIGDSEGARALIEEVVAEASGSLKARAQKQLADLG